jgi:hypothetical protein
MDQSHYVSPGERSTPPGGGPEENPSYIRAALSSQGLLTLAFGFALGLTLVIIYFVIKLPFFPDQISRLLPALAENGLTTALYYFLSGFTFGTIVAGLYNLLVVKRLNLFGLEDSQH